MQMLQGAGCVSKVYKAPLLPADSTAFVASTKNSGVCPDCVFCRTNLEISAHSTLEHNLLDLHFVAHRTFFPFNSLEHP